MWKLFELLLQNDRIQKIWPYIPKSGVLVDIGCDISSTLINRAKHQMSSCIGIDSVIENKRIDSVLYKKQLIIKKIDVDSETANVVTMLAVLEHLDYPKEILEECYRILAPDGVLLMTVPSPYNRNILNVLAKFHLVRTEMIVQHKHYFSTQQLTLLLEHAGFRVIDVHLFQFGLNTFVKAIK